jgi:hypothetical protein
MRNVPNVYRAHYNSEQEKEEPAANVLPYRWWRAGILARYLLCEQVELKPGIIKRNSHW